MARISKKKYQLASDYVATYGILPWDGGYEMTVGLWQNAERAAVRKSRPLSEALEVAFGSPSESWFRAMTDTPEEAELYKALHRARPSGA